MLLALVDSLLTALSRKLLDAARRAIAAAEPALQTVLVVPDHRRRMLRAVLGSNGIAMPVLGLEEIDPGAELRLVGTIEVG